MNIQDLRKILISFADNASDVTIEKGKITAIIREELIVAQIIDREGEFYIKEDNNEMKLKNWISVRLAELPQLASRLKEYSSFVKEFIRPSGSLLDDIEFDPMEVEQPVTDVLSCLQSTLSRKIPGTTGVIYLTSDAGEGKTTLINQLARVQAQLYTKKESDWLLVPIPLGGRPFLRFDDIVIASLVNRLRFRSFYYESFIELVKLGLIIPAFDGFEEMLLESSSGEALSATGQLMAKLNSSGNVLIAARQAFFDYQNFDTQAKLFDTISKDSVTFSKVSINRWNRDQFIEYAFSQDIIEGEEIYEVVKNSLGSETHPLITRPVLVNKLLSVVQSTGDLAMIASALESSNEYFPKFVDAIIIREAETKWIDTSGDPFKPLLSVEQHYDLLGVLAEEMWLNNTNSLSFDIVDLLADLYCESRNLSIKVTRQIKERLKLHALIVKADQNPNHLRFDHEEFQEFFLGVSMFNTIKTNKQTELKNLLRKGLIHHQTIETIATYCIMDTSLNVEEVVKLLNDIQINELPSSFIKENCGGIILRILSTRKSVIIGLDNYSFSSNSLNNVQLFGIVVKESHFQITALTGTVLENCEFVNCTFDSLEIDKDHLCIRNTSLIDCSILSVQNKTKELGYYDPFNIKKELSNIGFNLVETIEVVDQPVVELIVDKDMEIVERALRRFIRSSQINDDIFRMRLGPYAEHFLRDLLPILIDRHIILEVEYIGSGQKRRFKLIVPFDKINYALKESKGNFELFLETVKNEK